MEPIKISRRSPDSPTSGIIPLPRDNCINDHPAESQNVRTMIFPANSTYHQSTYTSNFINMVESFPYLSSYFQMNLDYYQMLIGQTIEQAAYLNAIAISINQLNYNQNLDNYIETEDQEDQNTNSVHMKDNANSILFDPKKKNILRESAVQSENKILNKEFNQYFHHNAPQKIAKDVYPRRPIPVKVKLRQYHPPLKQTDSITKISAMFSVPYQQPNIPNFKSKQANSISKQNWNNFHHIILTPEITVRPPLRTIRSIKKPKSN